MEDPSAIDELKDMVSGALASRGVLAKLRAQLRAAVYAALDEADGGSGTRATGSPLASAGTHNAALSLVAEFLHAHGLKYTASVLASEAGLDDAPHALVPRPALAASLGLASVPHSTPLLDVLATEPAPMSAPVSAPMSAPVSAPVSEPVSPPRSPPRSPPAKSVTPPRSPLAPLAHSAAASPPPSPPMAERVHSASRDLPPVSPPRSTGTSAGAGGTLPPLGFEERNRLARDLLGDDLAEDESIDVGDDTDDDLAHLAYLDSLEDQLKGSPPKPKPTPTPTSTSTYAPPSLAHKSQPGRPDEPQRAPLSGSIFGRNTTSHTTASRTSTAPPYTATGNFDDDSEDDVFGGRDLDDDDDFADDFADLTGDDSDLDAPIFDPHRGADHFSLATSDRSASPLDLDDFDYAEQAL